MDSIPAYVSGFNDPPGYLPSLAGHEPEETDLDDDSFR
jgi:hypothetical protein